MFTVGDLPIIGVFTVQDLDDQTGDDVKSELESKREEIKVIRAELHGAFRREEEALVSEGGKGLPLLVVRVGRRAHG